MSRLVRKADFGPLGFSWLTLKRITVRATCVSDPLRAAD